MYSGYALLNCARYPLVYYLGRARLQVGQFQGALVYGHNNLSLDGCKGDSGKGEKSGISLNAESRNVLGEVINDPVRFLLPY